MEIAQNTSEFSDLRTVCGGIWLWFHVVQLLLLYAPIDGAFWERKAYTDLVCPFFNLT